VCPRDVVPWSAPPRTVGKANDLESGVLIRVEHRAFQRLEPLAQNTGLRYPELTRQPTEPGARFGIEVHLDRFPDAARTHDFIS